MNALHLQVLEIYFCYYHPQWTFIINNGSTLPLHSLKLTECPLSWYSSFNLSGVTTLSLCFVPSPSQQGFLEFLTTLGCMQALIVLHLKHAHASACDFLSSSAFTVFQKVTLPLIYFAPILFSLRLIFSFLMITHPFHVISLLTLLVFIIASFHPLLWTSLTHSCSLIYASSRFHCIPSDSICFFITPDFSKSPVHKPLTHYILP